MFLSKSKKHHIHKSNFLKRLKEIAASIGIKENIKTHTLRKYFISCISTLHANNVLDATFSEHLIGHKLKNLSTAYNMNLKAINWFYESWKKAESVLSMNIIIRNDPDKKLIELQKHFAEEMALKKHIIQSQAQDILSLKDHLNNSNGYIQDLEYDHHILATQYKKELDSLKSEFGILLGALDEERREKEKIWKVLQDFIH